MPIDSSNSPSDGGLGPDPAGTKVGADDIVIASKDDVDLGDAGTGAKSSESIDLSLDDAGQGAKVDPSRADDDPTAPIDKGGLGSPLDDVAVKDLDLDLDLDGGKDLDFGAPDPLHDDHIKGLSDDDRLDDDHDGPDDDGPDDDGLLAG